MPNIISFTLVKVLLLAEEINFIFWSVLKGKTPFAKSLLLFIKQFNHTLGQAKGASIDRNVYAVLTLQLLC